MAENPSLLSQGRSLAQAGQFQEALKVFDEILKDHPDEVTALFFAGACWFQLKSYPQARQSWLKVLQIQPDNEKAKAWLAKIPPEEPAWGAAPAEPPATSPSAVESKLSPRAKQVRPRKPLFKWVGIVAAIVVLALMGLDMYANPDSYPFLRKDKVALEWKWTPGESLRYRAIVGLSVKMTPTPQSGDAGQPNPMAAMMQQMMNLQASADLTAVVNQTVREVADNGTATIDLTLETLDVKTAFPGPESPSFSYNASSPTGSTGSTPFGDPSEALKEPITYLVDRFGKVEMTPEDRERFLEFRKESAAEEGLSATVHPASDQAELTEGLQALFDLTFGKFPTERVAVGATWDDRYEQSDPLGSVTVVTKYTLEGKQPVKDEECVKIVFDTDIDLFIKDLSGQSAAAIPIPGSWDLKFEETRGSGELYFSQGKGRTVQNTANLLIKLALIVTMPKEQVGEMPPMEAKVQLDGKLNVELL